MLCLEVEYNVRSLKIVIFQIMIDVIARKLVDDGGWMDGWMNVV